MAETGSSDTRPKLLIVDDDHELCSMLVEYLGPEGFATETVGTGPQALDRLLRGPVDLMVLDVMLPELSGFEVLRRIRATSRMPVIMLTARGSETDLVVGLEVGADDYLAKPVSMRELTARVRALLRRVERSAAHPDRILRVGEIEIDVSRRRVRFAGQLVALTATEFDLLVYLLATPGVVRSREELLTEVWGYRDGSGPRTVDSHVRAIRRKVGSDMIRTVHSIGYAGADGAEA